jgi:hypothetical protein
MSMADSFRFRSPLCVMAAVTWCGRPQPVANCNQNCNHWEIAQSPSTATMHLEVSQTKLAGIP